MAVETVRGWTDSFRSSRLLATLLSQALLSGANFACILLAANQLSSDDLGRFVTVYSSTVFLVGLNQTMNAEYSVLRWSKRELPREPYGLRSSIIKPSLNCGICAAFLIAASALFLTPEWQNALLVIATAIPFLFVADANRCFLQAAGSSRSSLRNDVAVVVLFIVLALAYSWYFRPTLLGVLVIAVAPPAVLGMFLVIYASWVSGLASEQYHAGAATINLAESRSKRRDLGLEYLMMQGVNQLCVYLVGGWLGLAALGAWRSVQSLYGPLNILFTAVRVSVAPRLIRQLASSRVDSRRKIWIRMGSPLLLGGGVGVAVLTISAQLLGDRLLGGAWRMAQPLLAVTALQYCCLCLVNLGLLALRATVRTDLSRKIRAGQSMLTLAGVCAGLLANDILTVAYGTAFAAAVSAALWLIAARRSLAGMEIRR